MPSTSPNIVPIRPTFDSRGRPTTYYHGPSDAPGLGPRVPIQTPGLLIQSACVDCGNGFASAEQVAEMLRGLGWSCTPPSKR